MTKWSIAIDGIAVCFIGSCCSPALSCVAFCGCAGLYYNISSMSTMLLCILVGFDGISIGVLITVSYALGETARYFIE